MKKTALIMILLFSLLAGCAQPAAPAASPAPTETQAVTDAPQTDAPRTDAAPQTSVCELPAGQIYLYGEAHDQPDYLEKELELWGYFYSIGMRDLFTEDGYCCAGWLNLWMQADDDEILLQLYDDCFLTASHSENYLAFYRAIKERYPETVFHGIDVEHQYDSTGVRYLDYLRTEGKLDTEEYELARSSAMHGRAYYELEARDMNAGEAYRENRMAESFLREMQRCSGSVMGIFGAAHCDPNSQNWRGTVPSMAKQVAARYGDALHAFPDLEDYTVIVGRAYETAYFGCHDASCLELGYDEMELRRCEAALADFENCPLTGLQLPAGLIPVIPTDGMIVIADFIKGGKTERCYLRPGTGADGWPAMLQFDPSGAASAQCAEQNTPPAPQAGEIALFVEAPAQERFLAAELETWGAYYAEGVRDLFLELSFRDATLLNQWMQADDDALLSEICFNAAENEADPERMTAFYRAVREQYPETVFHGVDLCRDYSTVIKQYLDALQEAGREDSEEYRLALRSRDQGLRYHLLCGRDESLGEAYRESCLAANLLLEYEGLGRRSVMGIFRAPHTDPNSLTRLGTAPSMAMQLAAQYGDAVRQIGCVDLLQIGEREYEACYLGRWEVTGTLRACGDEMELWQCDAAYADLRACHQKSLAFRMELFPASRKEKTVVIADFTKDGETERYYFLADGFIRYDKPVLMQIDPYK